MFECFAQFVNVVIGSETFICVVSCMAPHNYNGCKLRCSSNNNNDTNHNNVHGCDTNNNTATATTKLIRTCCAFCGSARSGPLRHRLWHHGCLGGGTGRGTSGAHAQRAAAQRTGAAVLPRVRRARGPSDTGCRRVRADVHGGSPPRHPERRTKRARADVEPPARPEAHCAAPG
jgi:hypothetical protein